jgi:hypothetical protein
MKENYGSSLSKLTNFDYNMLVNYTPTQKKEVIKKICTLLESLNNVVCSIDRAKCYMEVGRLYITIKCYSEGSTYLKKAMSQLSGDEIVIDTNPELIDEILISFSEAQLKINEFNKQYCGLDPEILECLINLFNEKARGKKKSKDYFVLARISTIFLINKFRYDQYIVSSSIFDIVFGHLTVEDFYDECMLYYDKLQSSDDVAIQSFLFENMIEFANLSFSQKKYEILVKVLTKIVVYINICIKYKIPFNKEYIALYFERLAIYIFGCEQNFEASCEILEESIALYKGLYEYGILYDNQSYALALLNLAYIESKNDKTEEAMVGYMLGFKITADLYKSGELRTNPDEFRDQFKVFYDNVWEKLKKSKHIKVSDMILFEQLIENYREILSNKELKRYMGCVKHTEITSLMNTAKKNEVSAKRQEKEMKEELKQAQNEIKNLQNKLAILERELKLRQDQVISNNQIVDIIKQTLRDSELFKITEDTNSLVKEMSLTNKKAFEVLQKGQDEIKLDIKNIKECLSGISAYQDTFGELLVKSNNDVRVREELFSAFYEKCWATLKEIVQDYKNPSFEIYKHEILENISLQNWNKMDDDAKTMLITSRVVYNRLNSMNDSVDYSPVSISIVKALEREVFRRFFYEYKNFLIQNVPNYEEWPSSMIDKRTKMPIADYRFSLGYFPLLIGFDSEKGILKQPNHYNREKFLSYANKGLFIEPWISDINKDEYLRDLALEICKIKNDYRNPTAHRNRVTKTDADACYRHIVSVTKVMEKILSKCKA